MEDQDRIKAAVARRKPAREELDAIQQEQNRLESTAKILDSNLYSTFIFLKQCAEMDSLPIERHREAISFARSMTALEGLPFSEETEQNLLICSTGEKSFSDFYMEYVRSHSVVE